MKKRKTQNKKFLKTDKELFLEKKREAIKKFDNHKKKNENTSHINRKVFHLLRYPFIYVNAYTKISKNKGATMKECENEQIIQYFGLKQAELIAKKITDGTYKFISAKRSWSLKPGKNTKRSIDVSMQSDKIVQEALRGILEAIYEPVFKEFGKRTQGLSNNYGFRPKSSAWSAMEKIQKYSRQCNLAITGVTVFAYNNVNHEILICILRKRIKDKKFLNLINSLLKSGVMDHKKFEHSLKGTFQGGIISPLLFNIYMMEFDKYVYDNFIQPILKREMFASNYNKAIYTDVPRLKKECLYVRYADNWVLTITATKVEAENIKTKLGLFLRNTLKIELGTKKIKVSYASEGYKFLGFEVRLVIKVPKQKMVLTKHRKLYARILRRTSFRQLTIEPDSSRLLKRMKLLNMYREKDNMPLGRPQWRIYHEFEIVQKYVQIFRGIFNYYYPCGRLTRLSHISYILLYSCAKTLAGKFKTSLRSVFAKYGKTLKIKMINLSTNGSKARQIEFLDFNSLKNNRKISKHSKFHKQNLLVV